MELQPSDRILLIREIARRLEPEEWNIVDLTLKQFSLPWSDMWSGPKTSYIISMLEKAPDDTLITLACHLGYDYSLASKSPDPDYWIAGFLRLFISHLATHKREAAAIQDALQAYGISAFVAHNDIEPATEWQNEIEMALATCDAMAALLHEGFHKSNWTDQEIGYVMGRGLLIIAVRLGQDPYGFIGRFQALDGMAKTPELLAANLFGILRKHKQTRERMAKGIVSRFEASYTFAHAKSNANLLAQAEYWDKQLSERCLAAIDKNGQINGAYGVPNQVRNIIKRKEEKL